MSHNLAALVAEMKNCEQMQGLSVLQHGQMVNDRYFEMLAHLRDGVPLAGEWKLPEWTADPLLLELQLPEATVARYAVYHDCGKPRCLVVDADGKRHFPDHARVSREVWLEHGGDPVEADLIGMDMDAHLLKDAGVAEFAARPQACTLLMVALCEVHANASLFGGVDTTSFKMKWKQLDRRGKAVLKAIRESAAREEVA
jgi:hypothetical protein